MVETNEIMAVDTTKQEIITDNSNYKLRLRELPEVKNLTNEISVDNPNSILTFGKKPSEGISKMSDQLLSTIKTVNQEEASAMLVQLTKIMDKFDIKEFEDNPESKGFLAKLFNSAKNEIDKLFAKYDDMGKEVDKIYLLLKQYESDTVKANDTLGQMAKANMEYFQTLEKYIVAGEIAQEEIEAYKNQVELNNDIPEQERLMQVQKLSMMKDMLNQRVYDLQVAENVAMQTVPMIQIQQMANFNLRRKIDSSFIITLPTFKNCLTQAIMLKRQQVMAKSLETLDQKTNELLVRNAENTVNQSVAIAKMAGGSSVNIETLKSTYETIRNGIDETKRITDELRLKRAEDSNTLENIKSELQTKGMLTTTYIPDK